MWPDGFPVADYVRRVRRQLDVSQRGLAEREGIGRATVSRLESGAAQPTVAVMERLLGSAGLLLLVVDGELRFVPPLSEYENDCRDGAERRYPAHLDVVIEPREGEWWGDIYGLARPPETFRRDREWRDRARAESRWQVRHQGPRPRWPLELARAQAALDRNQGAEDVARRAAKRAPGDGPARGDDTDDGPS